MDLALSEHFGTMSLRGPWPSEAQVAPEQEVVAPKASNWTLHGVI